MTEQEIREHGKKVNAARNEFQVYWIAVEPTFETVDRRISAMRLAWLFFRIAKGLIK